MPNKTLRKRAAISLILLFASIMMPVSAAIVHITHETPSSHTWLHIHVVVAVIFTVAGIFHVAYNLRTLKHYLSGKK